MINEQALEQLWEEHLNKSSKDKNRLLGLLQSKFYGWGVPKMLFQLFEKYIGSCESDGSEVITAKELNTASLRALMEENRACAIYVPGFCPVDIAESLSAQALKEYTNWKLGGVVSTDMFYAGGSVPREVACHNWPDFQRYFGEQEDFVRKQREMSGGSWPVDRLRLGLDEAWPFGACLGQWLGHKLRPAIMRVMHEENELKLSVPEHGFIHTDDSPKLNSLRGTFSANIYLKIPEEGGELYIWSINLKHARGVQGCLRAQILTMIQGYLFDMAWQQKIFKLLPAPNVIKPQVGDLVILNSGRPHSVAPVKKGVRVTNQLFIRANGRAPLIIGS